uniref:MGAT4 conserved region domain-containing protein n=1 Tax=Bos indicus x Bos taurus TaxID=30522 RepID=A0A4W2CKI5_BOBOX
LRRAAPGPRTVHGCLCKYLMVVVSLILLGSFLQERLEEQLMYSLLEEKKKILWQLNQQQISSEIKNHLQAFKDMQKTSPGLQRAKYKLLAGSLQPRSELLTVGISSALHPHESHLLDALRALFQASSGPELGCVVVLVSLSDSDPEWLSQTVANISDLFQAHIEARQLLVVRAQLGGPPPLHTLRPEDLPSSCEALYSVQKADHALLMNFAANLSEYFLMLDDQVRCMPKFISTIYWTLSAWKELPWVTLEFSSLSFAGKVFRSSDLPRLASFLLVFPKDTPMHVLLSEFPPLLAQSTPIRFGSSVFYHVGNRSGLESASSVRTDMVMLSDNIPQYAYTLNKESFATLNPVRGNYLTVILEEPQKVTRVEVLTGSDKEGKHQLRRGQVELGFGPLEDLQGCARYTLLGPVVEGRLDQMVSYEEDSLEALGCIRLLVLEAQESWLLIRQIKVWTTEYDEEEEG